MSWKLELPQSATIYPEFVLENCHGVGVPKVPPPHLSQPIFTHTTYLRTWFVWQYLSSELRYVDSNLGFSVDYISRSSERDVLPVVLEHDLKERYGRAVKLDICNGAWNDDR